MRNNSSSIGLILLLGFLVSSGCDGPGAEPHAMRRVPHVIRGQGADDGQEQPNGSRSAASGTEPAADDDARAPEDQVIEKALNSLELWIVAQDEKNPQRRAELEKKSENIKVSRQSLYSRE